MKDKSSPIFLSKEFIKLRREIIDGAEKEFARREKEYPHVVMMPHLVFMDIDFSVGEMGRMIQWLEENSTMGFVAFPSDAMGKYRDCWSNVYFQNSDDAIIFKLNWC